MFETRLHWLPIIIAIYLPVSFTTTYIIAVFNNHVEPVFPIISHTGNKSPESCVFSQLVNIGAGLVCIIIYMRYRYCLRRGLSRLNALAFIIGILSTVGVSIVGNFQIMNVWTVHLFGAILAFVMGFVYMVIQTVISYKSTSFNVPGNTRCIRGFRVGLCVAEAIFLISITAVAFGRVAATKGPGVGVENYEWTRAYPGYAEHLVSTISEWLAAVVTGLYFATFYSEFKHFRMKPPKAVYYTEDQRTGVVDYTEHQRTEI